MNIKQGIHRLEFDHHQPTDQKIETGGIVDEQILVDIIEQGRCSSNEMDRRPNSWARALW